MPAADPWLKRQNAALRLRGCDVSLEVAGARIRLRATLPARPDEPTGTPDRQRRISTGLAYPDQAAEAVELAVALGKALERHRVGVESFNWAPWLRLRATQDASVASLQSVSGGEAIDLARQWWMQHGKHRYAAEQTWQRQYERYLRPLRGIAALEPAHLLALVERSRPRSSSRKKQGLACAAVAKAMGWPEEVTSQILALSKGYSGRDVTRRELPSEAEIEAAIDSLKPAWQWPAGMMATYGCRPHEAMLYAEVLPSGVARIGDGKTGARQALALPVGWIERWDLRTKRVPEIDLTRDNTGVGNAVTKKFWDLRLGFRPYDLRHAWAVRAIKDPRISPSLAAKSMGHSLLMHSSVYQRWFDSHEMEAVQGLLSAAS